VRPHSSRPIQIKRIKTDSPHGKNREEKPEIRDKGWYAFGDGKKRHRKSNVVGPHPTHTNHHQIGQEQKIFQKLTVALQHGCK
jgi:hypothetical protein